MTNLMSRRQVVRLFGSIPFIASATCASGLSPHTQGTEDDDGSLNVYITGTMAMVVWDTHVELVMPHHSRLLYVVLTDDPNNSSQFGTYELFKRNQTYQLRGTTGSGTIPSFAPDSHVVLNQQVIHRGGRVHCNVLLPFPDRVETFCQVTRGPNDPLFFSKAPSGISPRSVFLHHNFVYKKFDPAHVGISTVHPVDNVLLIWSEPIKEGDQGPFKNNVKLIDGLQLELNQAYKDAGCDQTQQIAHFNLHKSLAKVQSGFGENRSFAIPEEVPFNRLPACMKLVVNNAG